MNPLVRTTFDPCDDFVSHVAATRLLMRADSHGVTWAVVAANGRVLGLSIGPLADTRAAQSDFFALCPLLPDLPVTFGREVGARAWTWRVGDSESGHIAVSGTAYERHATARAAFARFVLAATELCTTASGGPARPGQR